MHFSPSNETIREPQGLQTSIRPPSRSEPLINASGDDESKRKGIRGRKSNRKRVDPPPSDEIQRSLLYLEECHHIGDRSMASIGRDASQEMTNFRKTIWFMGPGTQLASFKTFRVYSVIFSNFREQIVIFSKNGTKLQIFVKVQGLNCDTKICHMLF